MPGEARKRWAILAKVIKSQESEEERRRGEGTKRSFHSYNLLTWGLEEPGGWRKVSHASTEVEVRLASASSPSLTQLVGFNNTGNVCVWPSEECLAVYCLQQAKSWTGVRVLELGGGMTGLAGLLLSATGFPASVDLTDGNPASAVSLEQVVERRRAEKGGSKLSAFPLRWDEEEVVEARRGQYDLIISADCVFFTSKLAQSMAALLAPGGRALVMAPAREGTLAAFQQEAFHHFTEVKEVERYNGLVWKAHEACLGMGDYAEDIHHPRLLDLRL